MDIVGMVQDNVVSMLVGAGALALGKFGYSAVKNLVGKNVAAALKEAFDIKTADAVKKKLILDVFVAIVKLAEYCIPDRGQGQKRKEVVLAVLTRALPKPIAKHADLLSGLIEEAVATMDDELKKISVPGGDGGEKKGAVPAEGAAQAPQGEASSPQ